MINRRNFVKKAEEIFRKSTMLNKQSQIKIQSS